MPIQMWNATNPSRHYQAAISKIFPPPERIIFCSGNRNWLQSSTLSDSLDDARGREDSGEDERMTMSPYRPSELESLGTPRNLTVLRLGRVCLRWEYS